MPPETSGAVPSLDRVQRWLQAVIVHPGSVEEGLAAPEAKAEVPREALERVVRPSWSLSAAERVDVYHGMYLLRMVEALESDYPAVRHFLGEEAFAELVRDYVQRYPSRSYTLNRLGDHLPQFFLDEPTRPHAAFLHDLARAELAVTEVFDEEESPVLDAETLGAVPEQAWAGAHLRPIKALRLLALRHQVTGHLDAAKHGRFGAAPATAIELPRRPSPRLLGPAHGAGRRRARSARGARLGHAARCRRRRGGAPPARDPTRGDGLPLVPGLDRSRPLQRDRGRAVARRTSLWRSHWPSLLPDSVAKWLIRCAGSARTSKRTLQTDVHM